MRLKLRNQLPILWSTMKYLTIINILIEFRQVKPADSFRETLSLAAKKINLYIIYAIHCNAMCVHRFTDIF
jgi:hypothetical protein